METQKIVITSAQAFATPNHKFLDSLENYVNIHNAELIVLPLIGNSAQEDYHPSNFSKRIQEYDLEYGSRKLNKNIGIDQFNVRPYQVDPITGLQRFAQRDKSLVFGSPKQRWKYIAHSNRTIPKALITTGACTLPNYATGWDVSAERRRLGNIATRDHEYGAIVIDLVNGVKFHWRNLIAQKNGKFTDLGVEYSGKEKKEVSPLAAMLGDWHSGYTDSKVLRATLDMIKYHDPEKIFLEDFFNGHSVSHWRKGKSITELIWEGSDKGNLSLEEEMIQAGKDLELLKNTAPNAKVYVKASNHLEFLERYLDEGRYINDPINIKLALKLAVAFSEKKNPTKEGIELVYGLPDNVEFLSRWDDVKINGYKLDAHGDKAAGGGRGSIQSKERCFGKSITGHSHSSEKLRQTYILGTMLPFTMHYLGGSPLSWTHSHAMLYKTGVQMINIIDGKWRV